MIEIPIAVFIILLLPLAFCLFLIVSWVVVSIADYIYEKKAIKEYEEWQNKMKRKDK